MFDRWGRFVYRFRWAVLVVSALLLGVSIVATFTGGKLVDSGGFGADLPAGQASKLIAAELQRQKKVVGSQVTLIFRGSTLTVTDPTYKAALESALAPLADDPRVTSVSTPFTVPAEAQASYISRDQHEALVIVALKDSSSTAKGYIAAVLAEIHPGNLTMLATGGVL
ncbi:MAG TPA: MMPL family transporter, partial [Streptosporangiaceae bacterium]|nr:MMPL family transporter [Streptosporangiaceae bacterium]